MYYLIYSRYWLQSKKKKKESGKNVYILTIRFLFKNLTCSENASDRTHSNNPVVLCPIHMFMRLAQAMKKVNKPNRVTKTHTLSV